MRSVCCLISLLSRYSNSVNETEYLYVRSIYFEENKWTKNVKFNNYILKYNWYIYTFNKENKANSKKVMGVKWENLLN